MIKTRLAALTSEISSECIFSYRLPVSDCHGLELTRSVPHAQQVLHAYVLGNAGCDGKESIPRAHGIDHSAGQSLSAHVPSADSTVPAERDHHSRRDSAQCIHAALYRAVSVLRGEPRLLLVHAQVMGIRVLGREVESVVAGIRLHVYREESGIFKALNQCSVEHSVSVIRDHNGIIVCERRIARRCKAHFSRIDFKELAVVRFLNVPILTDTVRAGDVDGMAKALRVPCSRDNSALKRFGALILDADDRFLERATLERAVVVDILNLLAEEKNALLRGRLECILDAHLNAGCCERSGYS